MGTVRGVSMVLRGRIDVLSRRLVGCGDFRPGENGEDILNEMV